MLVERRAELQFRRSNETSMGGPNLNDHAFVRAQFDTTVYGLLLAVSRGG
jgi:hypothetical protein